MPRKAIKKPAEKPVTKPVAKVDPIYADYVAGKNIQAIADKLGRDPLEVLKHIQKEERNGRRTA